MSIQYYDKLVRDRIPEIISESGGSAHFEQLDTDAFIAALKAKLIEEAVEVQSAEDTTLRAELADLQEVVDALLKVCGITRAEVDAEQLRRRTERGAFDRQIKLLSVEHP